MTARPPEDDDANSPASQALARGQKGSSLNFFCIAWQESTSFGQECAKGHLSGVSFSHPNQNWQVGLSLLPFYLLLVVRACEVVTVPRATAARQSHRSAAYLHTRYCTGLPTQLRSTLAFFLEPISSQTNSCLPFNPHLSFAPQLPPRSKHRQQKLASH